VTAEQQRILEPPQTTDTAGATSDSSADTGARSEMMQEEETVLVAPGVPPVVCGSCCRSWSSPVAPVDRH